jgi:hypothetical protein
MGAVQFEPSGRIWGSWAPPRCKFFAWLTSLNCCWTVDRLARQGLDHPSQCLFCDQEDETIHHIFVGCVFSREVWFRMLSSVGLQGCTPKPDEKDFQEWWRTAELKMPRQIREGFNSLVFLILWSLWKHRNVCVFDNLSPAVTGIIIDIRREVTLWCMAGAKGLSSLGLGHGTTGGE